MAQPFVTVAVHCADREATIEAFLRGVLAEEWPHDAMEVIVADAMSLDATREILLRLTAEEPRVRVLENPEWTRAAGLNRILRAARGSIIVRMDADCTYPTGYIAKCVAALEASGADHAGGSLHSRGRGSLIARAIGAAESIARGDAKTNGEARLGAFARRAFERAGLFDERAVDEEDADLDARIRRAGGNVVALDDLAAVREASPTIREATKAAFSRGKMNARHVWKHKSFSSIAAAAPLAAIGAGLAILAAPTMRVGSPVAIGGYYLLSNAVKALRATKETSLAAAPIAWAVLPVMHASHAAGFAAGLVIYRLRPDWETELLPRDSVSPECETPAFENG